MRQRQPVCGEQGVTRYGRVLFKKRKNPGTEGEGALAYAGEFYIEPLEVQIEFLKAANAEKWLEALLLRHVDRVRQVSEELFVIAEIKSFGA